MAELEITLTGSTEMTSNPMPYVVSFDLNTPHWHPNSHVLAQWNSQFYSHKQSCGHELFCCPRRGAFCLIVFRCRPLCR
jgi:hypothetical protein